ncbi:MAG: orotidine-5'-phosphate decarboxylase [Porphyromonas sp.]|nr:orotidine-5'-phosphate decarboxylase [Porphyromonas sp.]
MERDEIIRQIRAKRSFLCVGLDSDPLKLPTPFTKDASGVLAFNKAIIDATAPYAVAYKPNAAFYEAMGYDGVRVLEQTVTYLQERYPECFVILDAKRGDIGNTSGLYARAAFERMGVDAVTIAPYMGEDSVAPFLQYPEKWVVLLALTSNAGSADFQQKELGSGAKLYQEVLKVSQTWGNPSNMMYVVGATKAEYLTEVRSLVPNHFLLVPGVGAQGGSLQEVAKYGMTPECGLLVNSSRGIIFAGKGDDFADAAAEKARELQKEMSEYLHLYAGI